MPPEAMCDFSHEQAEHCQLNESTEVFDLRLVIIHFCAG